MDGTYIALSQPFFLTQQKNVNKFKRLPASTPAATHKRTAREADFEIAHLEAIVKCLPADPMRAPGLTPAYWRSRATALERNYMLLPPQTARINALHRAIDEFEGATAESAPLKEERAAA
ncbi:hypothetical protein CR51_00810 [Caballeronia megalochromosomata]|nr:hypothetical protein CR51_00810 [Caballeronia megalochromosomata]